MDSAIFGEYLRQARKNGIRIVLYINVHLVGHHIETFPKRQNNGAAWERDMSERYAQRNIDGSFGKIYGTKNCFCLCGPYCDYFFTNLKLLADYEVDGIFLDGPSWIPGGCFCEHCRQRYRREFGGELTEKTDRTEFDTRVFADFFKETWRCWHEINPDGVFYQNLAALYPAPSFVRLSDALVYNDIVGTEGGFMFYGPPKNGYLWKPSMAAKVLEAIAPDKPRVVFMAADQKPWNYYQHTATETELCIGSIIANGANLWYGSVPSFPVLMDRPALQRAWSLMRTMAGHDEYFAESRSAARVAVMYSYASMQSYRTTAEESDLYGADGKETRKVSGNAGDSFRGVYDALSRSSVPFDVVADLEFALPRFSNYDCIFLPTCACLSDKAVDALRCFVQNGGHLVSCFDTSLYTEDGKRRPDFGLADVLGVSYLGREIKMQTFNYYVSVAKHGVFDRIVVPCLPAPAFGLDVKPHGKAQVLARFLKPLAGRYDSMFLPPEDTPAIVLNRYGKGTSLFLAGTFGEMAASYNPPELTHILANAAQMWSHQPVRLEGAFGNVELAVRRQPGRLIVHLVNYAGIVPRPFTGVVPQSNLVLRIQDGQKYRRARTILRQETCALRRSGGALTIRLPELNEYEVVVLE
ncbi:MAG: beta-galactosidase trimerization domain-containing protein [Verrucomicrobia bacterium]|nr:beta-galactosidase trimerization domain-containing protein [Verrucomicrobiota bacterium]MBU4291726.1 beta-galactosidase trimerization domain-containing protein [Verrucomicrobiota bacterium]MBU4428117.1 beta-galactosidase trimerization domain-containing protein [Verrucomicrobiota bacterium]MCG2681277.1 beta-galactosidase trimerization domain-containing protein [Kiritimatiellia bacterium]